MLQQRTKPLTRKQASATTRSTLQADVNMSTSVISQTSSFHKVQPLDDLTFVLHKAIKQGESSESHGSSEFDRVYFKDFDPIDFSAEQKALRYS